MYLPLPATSPDDDYFDGYKSADSKPSDSTSQFSTDQSDGDDFKNFDNYLDEFQRKRDQQEKESPLHRPVTKHKTASSPQTNLASKTPPKLSMFPMPTQNRPADSQPQFKPTMPFMIGASVSNKPDSADDFSDFADFHSAPYAPPPTQATNTNVSSVIVDTKSATKSATPVRDLIGDEDKYAALRSVDFSTDLMDTSTLSSPPPTQNSAPVEDDDWADFTQGSAGFSEPLGAATPGEKGAISGSDFATDFQQASWEGKFYYCYLFNITNTVIIYLNLKV